MLTVERWCKAHSKNSHISRPSDHRRGNSTQRGYDAAWRELRLVALRRDHYLCVKCLAKDRPEPATDVDHILTIAEHPELRLVLENLQSLCGKCHRQKTAQELKRPK